VNEWSKNRHFQLPHSHLTPPLQRTPANICINIILPETTFLGYIFIADSIWVALQMFEQFCPKAGDANPLVGIIEEPLMGYLAQYNKCGRRCEDSEDIASERSENHHFRPPHSHLTPPLQRIPANICIKLILLETRIPGLHFCRW